MSDSLASEREEAHAELAQERWVAHREQHRGEKELAAQKWDAHADQHDSIARNLVEYKAQSNEWRAALTDMRITFLSKAEYQSAHQALIVVVENLEKGLANEREERRDQQTLRTGQQEGISRTGAIIVTAIGLVGTLFGSFAILLNILK